MNKNLTRNLIDEEVCLEKTAVLADGDFVGVFDHADLVPTHVVLDIEAHDCGRKTWQT